MEAIKELKIQFEAYFLVQVESLTLFFRLSEVYFSKISVYFLVLYIFIVLYYSNTQQTEEEREKKPKQNTF